MLVLKCITLAKPVGSCLYPQALRKTESLKPAWGKESSKWHLGKPCLKGERRAGDVGQW